MKKTISVFALVLLLAALLQSWVMKESHPATGGRSELNVATFNLRMDTEKDGVNAWPFRFVGQGEFLVFRNTGCSGQGLGCYLLQPYLLLG